MAGNHYQRAGVCGQVVFVELVLVFGEQVDGGGGQGEGSGCDEVEEEEGGWKEEEEKSRGRDIEGTGEAGPAVNGAKAHLHN